MNLTTLLGAIVVSAIMACGAANNLESSDGPSVGLPGPPPAGKDHNTQQGDKVDRQDDSTFCLSECSVPEVLSFSYRSPLRITPADCVTSGLEVFDQGYGLMMFYVADCGDSTQVYSIQTSYEGTNATTPAVISTDCEDAGADVQDYSVAMGLDSWVVAFTCGVNPDKPNTYATSVNSSGLPGDTYFIETLDINNASYSRERFPYLSYSLAWNPEAQAYGLVRRTKMQRLDWLGQPIGGAIYVADGAQPVSGVFSQNGDWIVLGGGNSLGQNSTQCSKVDSQGIALCDKITIDETKISFLPDTQVTSADRYGRVFLSRFDPDTCQTTGIEKIGSVSENPFEQAFNAVPLSKEYASLLVESTSGVLQTVSYSRQKGAGIEAVSSIANVAEPSHGQVLVARDHLIVSWIDQNSGWFSISNQPVK